MRQVNRVGITIPFEGLSLSEQREWFSRLEDAGYTDFWGAEADGLDGFVPAAAAALSTLSARIGIAVIPVFTRGPALIAQSAQSLSELAEERFVLGIGASSPAIVQRWNGIAFDHPYERVRDTLRFLKAALRGEKVTQEYSTFKIEGFVMRRDRSLFKDPPIYLGALRPRMIELAVREADGLITNWLRAEDVKRVREEVEQRARAAGREVPEVVGRIFVIPTEDKDSARGLGAYLLNAYLNVGAYREFHRWLGNEEYLKRTWEAWEAGDRKGALAAIPGEFVDQVTIHGSAAEVAEQVRAYVENGIDTPVIALISTGPQQLEFCLELIRHLKG